METGGGDTNEDTALETSSPVFWRGKIHFGRVDFHWPGSG